MSNQEITFDKTNPEDVKNAAIFVAQLVKEGVTFRTFNDVPNQIVVQLTGGF
jgi:hypothetical protein